jgi:mRNA interferase HicA
LLIIIYLSERLKVNNYVLLCVKSNELIRLLQANGWQLKSQRGSHMKFINDQRPGVMLVVPNHGAKEIARGLELRIKKDAGLR